MYNTQHIELQKKGIYLLAVNARCTTPIWVVLARRVDNVVNPSCTWLQNADLKKHYEACYSGTSTFSPSSDSASTNTYNKEYRVINL
jgi:hypothetical protein